MGLVNLLPTSITQGPIGNLVTALFRPARAIGPFATQVTIEEIGEDELQITDHPVEFGAMITDHAFAEPARVLIRCGFSNSSLASLITDVAGILNLVVNGSVGPLNYAQSVYTQMLALQKSRVPFSVTTGKRTYQSMLIKHIRQHTDKDSENVLMLSVFCREVILVSTSTTNAPNSNGTQPTPQNPATNSPPSQNGTLSLTPGQPAPGGSFPIPPG